MMKTCLEFLVKYLFLLNMFIITAAVNVTDEIEVVIEDVEKYLRNTN